MVFRRFVPRSVRRARRVLTVSERTKRDLIELYRTPPEKIVVTPNGVDPRFSPAEDAAGGYLLYVGAIQKRKDPLAAVDAATEVGLPLVVVGPEKEPDLARELRRRGADLRGYVEGDRAREPLPQRRRRSSSHRGTKGSGSRCSRRWQAGRRSLRPTMPPCARSAGAAALYAQPGDLRGSGRARP